MLILMYLVCVMCMLCYISYAMKRMRRKFKAMQRDIDGRAVDWRTLYMYVEPFFECVLCVFFIVLYCTILCCSVLCVLMFSRCFVN